MLLAPASTRSSVKAFSAAHCRRSSGVNSVSDRLWLRHLRPLVLPTFYPIFNQWPGFISGPFDLAAKNDQQLLD